MSSIQFVDKISDELEHKMEKDLVSYEIRHLIDVNYKKFALVLFDDANEEVGVISAFTCFSEIHVDDLWVASEHRGKGYGRQLLEALEEHYKDEGFNNINLVTNEFQAPTFYEKCGYELEFIRKNTHNPKLNKYFFVKYFDNNEQTQGTIPTIPSKVLLDFLDEKD